MFPRLQPSAYYEELPYSYFRPVRSTRLLSLGTIPLIRPLLCYIIILCINGSSALIPNEVVRIL